MFCQSGDVHRYCLMTEDWSGQPLDCVPVNCTSPVPPHSVVVDSGQSVHVYKDTVRYQCEEGYELVSGDTHRTCQADQTFSGTPPVCKSKYYKLHFSLVLKMFSGVFCMGKVIE